MELRAIEIVEDRTATSRCDEGFLTVARLRLRNRYADGSLSEPYACDVVSRPGSDAVVAVLFERVDGAAGRGVHVLLREGPRAPVYLRRHKKLVHPDPREYLALEEVVAGIVEAEDGAGDAGLRRRAAAEALEEAGCAVPEGDFAALGGEAFASPGTSDEKLYFCAAETRLAHAGDAPGDGSVMERDGRIVVRELGEAIRACRSGAIPDLKTEVALLRLADHVGYLPQLGCFADELPESLRRRYRRPGLAGEGAAD